MARDVRLIRSPMSVVGMVLTTVSAVLFLVVFLADLFGLHTNPYIGIVFFLILPGIFLLGLLLIPLGAWLERRRRAAGKPPSEVHWPRVDLNVPSQRRTAVAIFALTMANVVIVSLAAYRGIEYMDSVQFCGQVCHEVMKPEFTAYQDGPHSRVTCVACHIGPGASWFARSKVSGLRQVVAVSLNSFSRPIPSPVHDLRPAREVCEQCHWPEKFHGDLIRRKAEYADDEANSETVTTLQLKVGGGSERTGGATGIHWHTNPQVEIEYITTDEKRQVIPYVRLQERDGTVPQPPEPSDGGHGRAGGGRRDREWRDSEDAAVRAPGSREGGEGDLSVAGGGGRIDCGGAARVLPDRTPGGVHVAAPGRREGGGGRRARLPAQRVPGDEGAVRHLPEQHRAHGLARLLPVPR
jgi:hypothetical protein